MLDIVLHGGLGNQLFQLSVAHSLSKFVELRLNKTFIDDGRRELLIDDVAQDLGLEISSAICHKGHKPSTGPADLAKARHHCCSVYYPSRIEWASHIAYASIFHTAIETMITKHSACTESSALVLHARLGDYLWPRAAVHYGVLTEQYYLECLSHFPNENYVIIAEDRSAARRIYPNIVGRASNLSGGNDVVTDLDYLASGEGLIAANSSLSFWAVWLGSQRRKSFHAVVPTPMHPSGAMHLEVPSRPQSAIFWKPGPLLLAHPWVLTRRLKWQGKWWI